jgi:protein involved in polysaccharide export with SLBB domain
MLVYVTGEVKKPGEYLVSDTADVASLVMMAGGATEFGSLSDLTIRRGRGVAGFGNPETPTVERFDLERYLEAKDGTAAPRLNPGDVVHVPSNAWFAWDRSFSMIRDVAVIVTTVLLYIRVVEQN